MSKLLVALAAVTLTDAARAKWRSRQTFAGSAASRWAKNWAEPTGDGVSSIVALTCHFKDDRSFRLDYDIG